MSDPREGEVARFWSKVRKGSSCWPWQGRLSAKGYGLFDIGSHSKGEHRPVRAHRYAYELVIGRVPAGLTLDHLCRNRACVDPSHLEPVAAGVNVLRGNGITAERARSPHCPNGHPYDLFNTDTHHGWRICRICKRANARRKYLRRRRSRL